MRPNPHPANEALDAAWPGCRCACGAATTGCVTWMVLQPPCIHTVTLFLHTHQCDCVVLYMCTHVYARTCGWHHDSVHLHTLTSMSAWIWDTWVIPTSLRDLSPLGDMTTYRITGNEALKSALLQRARRRCCEYSVGFEKYTHDAQALHDKLVKLKERVTRKLAVLSKLQAVLSKDGTKDAAKKDGRVHNVGLVFMFTCVCVLKMHIW